MLTRRLSNITVFASFVAQLYACAPATTVEASRNPSKNPATAQTPTSTGQTPNNNIPGTSTPTTTNTAMPPAADLAAPPVVSGSDLAYDMGGTLTRANANSAVMRLGVQKAALKGKTALRIQGKMFSLRDSRNPIALDKAVTADARGVIDFTVDQLQPETIYRIEEIAVSDATNASLTATAEEPYFIGTSGTTPLATARRFVTLRALNEAYAWERNMYDKSKKYADASGWCDRFYTWAASGAFSVSFEDDFAPDWFSQHNALSSASTLATVAGRESVMGDMVRYDSTFKMHTFMIVSYDAGLNQLWTVEGNFNDAVLRSERTIESWWKLGHLNASLLK